MKLSSLSKEDLLLLFCARKDADKQVINNILGKNVNWDHITMCAQQHGISPLLYRNLCLTEDTTLLPEWVIKNLRGQYYATVARNMKHYDELNKILGSFKKEGIDVVVLKGAALAEAVYQDISLRGFNDIDILVRKNDLNRAKNVAIAGGYALEKIHSPEAYMEKFGYNLHYIKDITLEIHWNISRRIGNEQYIKIDIDEVWNNAIPLKISNDDSKMLSPEDQLIHLSIHLASHNYDRLIWFCDISEIIRHYDIKWEKLIQNARKYRTKAYVYYTLYFTSELFGVKVPSRVLQEIRPNNLETRLFYSIPEDIIHINTINVLHQINPLIDLLLIDRGIDRIKYIWNYFFPQAEVLSHRYSVKGPAIYIYYIAHPLYQILRGTKRLASLVTSKSGF